LTGSQLREQLLSTCAEAMAVMVETEVMVAEVVRELYIAEEVMEVMVPVGGLVVTVVTAR